MHAINLPEERWLLCPVCRSKTRIKLLSRTVLQNFLLFCPKCRMETLINVEKFNIQIMKEPDAKIQKVFQTQSR